MTSPATFQGNFAILQGTNTTEFGFGDLSVARNANILGTTVATSTTTGALTVAGGVGIAENLYIGGSLFASGGNEFILTASNVGAGGTGVFKQKVLSDLQFKNINAGSSKISITNDTGNSEIDVDLIEANVVHQNLSGAGTNTHAQIDTHIVTTNNPHAVTIDQVTPTTTKGDLLVENGSNVVRLPVGLDNFVLTADSAQSTGVKWAAAPGASGGEANTMSNIGVGGVGIFINKVGVDLRLKNINAGSSKISITDDVGNNEVDVNVVEANVVHQNLSGAGTNTHAQIDTHIASVANPHAVTIDQVTPTTTKGDLLVENGSNVVRLPVGTDTQLLSANSATATGLEWVASTAIFGSQFQRTSNTGSAIVNSATFAAERTITTGSLPSGNYRIGWHYAWNLNNAANDFRGRVMLDAVTQHHNFQEEPKDPAADQIHNVAGFSYTGTISGVHTITLEFALSSGSNIGTVYNTSLEFWRVA